MACLDFLGAVARSSERQSGSGSARNGLRDAGVVTSPQFFILLIHYMQVRARGAFTKLLTFDHNT